MKNVYLYLIALLFSASSYAQLQNTNWYFGRAAGVTFSTTPPATLLGGAISSERNSATVSDDSGNLLFYSDGRKIWNKNHDIMANGSGLKGDTYSTQGTIIVPKPGNSKKYYVITISGAYSDNVDAPRKGLYYNEVNMDLASGLGDITPGIKNLPLKDHNGVNIDENYIWGNFVGNYSQKLTSTVHSNGIDYWIVTQIFDKVYSYKVTSSGINLIPNSYTNAPLAVTTLQSSSANIKISPNTQRIVIGYGTGLYDNIEQKTTLLLPPGNRAGLVFGTFNNTTGQVIFDSTHLILPEELGVPFCIDFSPNSRFVYFSNSAGISYIEKPTGTLYSQSINASFGVQLAINGKLYIKLQSPSQQLGVINTPNNFPFPDIQTNGPNMAEDHSQYTSGGLPQWVHKQQGSSCVTNLSTSSTINLGQVNRQASSTITSSNIITENGSANYHAGSTVILKPGFHGQKGSSFRGYIEGCSESGFSLRTSNEEDSAGISKTNDERIVFYPNPATDNVTISSTIEISNITVTSLDGFTYFKGTPKTTSYELNISNYAKGIYVVNVTTVNGETESKKLIKE